MATAHAMDYKKKRGGGDFWVWFCGIFGATDRTLDKKAGAGGASVKPINSRKRQHIVLSGHKHSGMHAPDLEPVKSRQDEIDVLEL